MKIQIKGTDRTPYVFFNEGLIEIKGRSILEDASPFYKPLIEWLQGYIKHPVEFTQINFRIEYSNSNSNKFIFKIIFLLEECYLNGHDMKVSWYHEKDDDSVRDLGLDFQSLTKLPFELVVI